MHVSLQPGSEHLRAVRLNKRTVSMWEPYGIRQPKHVLLLLGLLEDPSMAINTGEAFAKAGYTTFSPTHERHSLRAMADPVGARVGDAIATMQAVDAEQGKLPWLVVAHSLAALVAARLVHMTQADNSHQVESFSLITPVGTSGSKPVDNPFSPPRLLHFLHEDVELLHKPVQAAHLAFRIGANLAGNPLLGAREAKIANEADISGFLTVMGDVLPHGIHYGSYDGVIPPPQELGPKSHKHDVGHFVTAHQGGAVLEMVRLAA